MSLLNSQTIFNILITLIICSAMFIFFRFKLRVLEISQTEQAKVLQSLVMSMRNGGHHRNIDMESSEEAMKHRQRQMQMQMQQNGGIGGSGGSGGGVNQHNHANDLINVSDEEGDDDEDEDEDDESESSSDSDDDSDSSLEDDNEETHDNTTKKIIFNNNGTLDAHTHPIEHLTGDDIKVIELTEPLYAVGAGPKYDNNNVSDDDGDNGDDGDDNEDVSDDDNDNDNDNDNDDDETSDDTEVKIEELPSHASLSLHQAQHLETSVVDTNEIKTIFKADKQQQQQQQHADYNSMNAQALKQHLKTKLSAEGMHYNETAINKLNKKELIKHLTQG